MPIPNEPTDMREVAMRAKIEREMGEDQDKADEQDVENAQARDRAMRALSFSVALLVLIALPLVGLVVGVAVRAFGWASGLY